jgi:hypothetical protein
VKRALQILGEARLHAGNRRHAPLPCLPVAGRRIDEHQLQPVLVQPRTDLGRVVGVGKLTCDRPKSRAPRGAEPLKERHLAEHHRQIRGKSWHRLQPG